jgi:hypothetical protein
MHTHRMAQVAPGVAHSSVWRSMYRIGIEPRTLSPVEPDPSEWPTSVVTATVVKALDARHPLPRYYITSTTRVRALLARLLPARLFDFLSLCKGWFALPQAMIDATVHWAWPAKIKRDMHRNMHPPDGYDPPGWSYAPGQWPHAAPPRNEYARAAQEEWLAKRE